RPFRFQAAAGQVNASFALQPSFQDAGHSYCRRTAGAGKSRSATAFPDENSGGLRIFRDNEFDIHAFREKRKLLNLRREDVVFKRVQARLKNYAMRIAHTDTGRNQLVVSDFDSFFDDLVSSRTG